MDGPRGTILEGGYPAWGEIRGWQDMEKGSSVLIIRGLEIVQALIFWAISTLIQPEASKLLLEELHKEFVEAT